MFRLKLSSGRSVSSRGNSPTLALFSTFFRDNCLQVADVTDSIAEAKQQRRSSKAKDNIVLSLDLNHMTDLHRGEP